MSQPEGKAMMGECIPMPRNPTLLESVLICNYGRCGHQSGPSQSMICDCCAASHPSVSIPVSYKTAPPWSPPPHYKEGQCRCSCHDEKVLHIMPCCDQTYRARSEMVPHAPRPAPVVGDFSKFTMPVVRPKKRTI